MTILFEGPLKNLEEITIKILSPIELSDLLNLQKKVSKYLSDSSSLQPLSEEEFINIFDDKGIVLGVFKQQELIAFRALLKPVLDEDHLGLDIGLAKEELEQVMYQEVSVVHPNYRGHGLQKTMGNYIMNEVDTQKYRYVCATVAPFNIPSIKDKFDQGLQIVDLKLKYDGLLRYVFMKDLHNKSLINRTEKIIISMNDIVTQQHHLQTGWSGVDIVNEKEEWKVIFQK